MEQVNSTGLLAFSLYCSMREFTNSFNEMVSGRKRKVLRFSTASVKICSTNPVRWISWSLTIVRYFFCFSLTGSLKFNNASTAA